MPMSPDSAGAQVRAAIRDLRTAIDALRRGRPETIDLRRLVVDVERVGEDIDLVLGPEPGAEEHTVHLIPDHDYDPQLFADADDEGVGPRRQ